MATTQVHHRGQTSRRKSPINSISNNDYLANELSRLEKELRDKRSELTMFRAPVTCIRLFLVSSFNFMSQIIKQCSTHPYFLFFLLPLVIIYMILYNIEGSHSPYVDAIYYDVEWILWWLILGILSSVGLGTGMHSGILFLFPHIAEVCIAAATCHSLSFPTYGPNEFICKHQHTFEESTVTFFGLFLKIAWPCFWWGTGTAMGEIPPYLVSLAAARAGKDDEFSEELRELSEVESENIQHLENRNNEYSCIDRLYRRVSHYFVIMKLWMIKFLERWGFWAVLAFAAWPNMAFDMCGIACGHFEMPFWKFFGATWIGKALIKVNLQGMFFVVLFSESMLAYFVDTIEHIGYDSIASSFHEFMTEQRDKFLNKEHEKTSQHTSPIKIIWGVIVGLFIGLFVGSLIQGLAQQYQRSLDEIEIDKWMDENNYVKPDKKDKNSKAK